MLNLHLVFGVRIRQPCRRCDIKFIWQDSFQPSVFKFCYTYNEKCEKLYFQPVRCSNHSLGGHEATQNKILLNYYFSLPDEGGVSKICQYLSFLVYFWKFWLRQGCLSFYGSYNWDKGADTDLMFQFCWPNPCTFTGLRE